MSYYIHNISPFALEFSPGFGIRWYGLSYAIGLLLAWYILIRLAKKGFIPLDAKDRANFIFSILLGIVIGGRLGFMLFYDLPRFLQNPLSFFEFWRGGMSSHGGFIGVGVACFIFSQIVSRQKPSSKEKANKISFWQLTDAMSIMTPAGLLLGRIANFINGELWGHIAHVPWAVIFPLSAPTGTPLSLIPPRHPSQLYEAFGEGLLLFIYTQIRYRQTKLRPHGQMTAEFLFFYAIMRIICECFREPDASLIFGVSRGIFYSALMIPLAVGLWFWCKRVQKPAA
jgi:phosphatidylglycerol:prolipoprotein diacylglycerol transferase